MRIPRRHAPGRSNLVEVGDVSLPSPRTQLIDRAKLAHSPDQTHFNASLIRFKKRLLLAYRVGTSGSRVHVAALDDNLNPVASVPLLLRHSQSIAGQEDPRLFVHNGNLYCSFVGVEFVRPGEPRTSQMLARLSDDLRVEEIVSPALDGRQHWEKNWVFFSALGELWSVYQIDPHIVLHHRGSDAHTFAEVDWKLIWDGGLLRGGAPPVLVGEEFYHWFHGRKVLGSITTYNTGVYTFEAKPPFKPLRVTPLPVQWPDHERMTPGDWKSVTFCCGSLLENGKWLVSYGQHDREIGVAEFDFDEVEKAMVKV